MFDVEHSVQVECLIEHSVRTKCSNDHSDRSDHPKFTILTYSIIKITLDMYDNIQHNQFDIQYTLNVRFRSFRPDWMVDWTFSPDWMFDADNSDRNECSIEHSVQTECSILNIRSDWMFDIYDNIQGFFYSDLEPTSQNNPNHILFWDTYTIMKEMMNIELAHLYLLNTSFHVNCVICTPVKLQLSWHPILKMIISGWMDTHHVCQWGLHQVKYI